MGKPLFIPSHHGVQQPYEVRCHHALKRRWYVGGTGRIVPLNEPVSYVRDGIF